MCTAEYLRDLTYVMNGDSTDAESQDESDNEHVIDENYYKRLVADKVHCCEYSAYQDAYPCGVCGYEDYCSCGDEIQTCDVCEQNR